jgi:transcriptional regulator with PAS, ATPase and Fis domain
MKLSHISENVQKISEAISSVLDVDVTISDETLTRIAATGHYVGQLGEKISKNSIFGYALKEGKDYIIDDPRVNPVCRFCDRRNECKEVAEVCSPIRHEGRIIGVIGLIAFEESQKERLLRDKKDLLVFLERMGDLISAKLSDVEKNKKIELLAKELQVIIDSFNNGVVFVNRDGVILHSNEKAKKILGTSDSGGYEKALKDFVDYVLGLKRNSNENIPLRNREYVSKKDNGRNRLIFDVNIMRTVGETVGFLISFNSKNDVLSVVNDVTGADPDITFDDILGNSVVLNMTKEYAEKASKSTSTILIQGESGTGKELFARSIHYKSDRRFMPFVTVNCAAIPENLLESELFGYEEGSFTGAMRGGKTGKFELADKGTIFLDEIGDMPIHLQKKLLRVLQNNTIEKIGGKHYFKVDIRVIAATNKDIEKIVEEGAFREDLFYRLSVIPLTIPSLRVRRDDISILADSFVKKYSEKFNKEIKGIQQDVLMALKTYDWPGNVRELENAVEYSVNMCNGESISLKDIPKRILKTRDSNKMQKINTEAVGIRRLETLERSEIERALKKHGHNERGIRLCVSDLGISRATLYRKIKKYNI